MTGRLEEVRRRARQWAKYAEDDLRLAQHALRMKANCPFHLVADHAQQCAEKYLKAYLVLKEVDFPFTDNISLLLELCADCAPWAGALVGAEALTVFGIEARYPGQDRPVSDEEAKTAVRLAKRVKKTLQAALEEQNVGG